MTDKSKDLTAALELGTQSLINAAVSKKTGEDTWTNLVNFAVQVVVLGGNLNGAFDIIEKKYKADFSVSQLPSKYRSAKSTILAAHTTHVRLIGDDGKPLGKTAVDRAARAASTTIINPPTPVVPKSAADYISAFDMLMSSAVSEFSYGSSREGEWNKFLEHVRKVSASLVLYPPGITTTSTT